MNKKTLLIVFVLIIVIASFFVWQNIQEKSTEPSSNNSPQPTIDSGSVLDLSGRGLDKIPGDVFSRTNIQELDVSNNNLTGAIQAEIRNLANLRVLNASNNQMTGIPAEIGQLEKLEVLNLSNNKLTGLPQELGNLKNLKTLNLSGNQYSQQDLDYIRGKLPTSTAIIVN